MASFSSAPLSPIIVWINISYYLPSRNKLIVVLSLSSKVAWFLIGKPTQVELTYDSFIVKHPR
uniref:Uncharacterized protein n=1 Tax=Manihot esculenta TaxID=3983 RepID=A0A2C9WLJ1_MANES